ncbi:hypothetical protein EJC51_46450 [Streptomyces aquilus]|uniref:Uncharacterized protein n=1 Tax=Streptomyces aquilus TaxID=2548456 RepID=A0A3Q9C2N8_9ACTN|nr:hypothetical protein [Streptomyces aquilus]AZP22832.1 hypothetical protein EJC51_46450 [Streptomyces aquilus]
MHRVTHIVRSQERLVESTGDAAGPDQWPPATQAVTRIGRAYVIEGLTDFDPDDLQLVRARFPHRHVTLDGDTITVWPAPLPTQP